MQEAVLKNTDIDTMEKVERLLAEAMGQASVTLGAGDFTQTSVIPVLPSRPTSYEGRSTARPTLFNLKTDGSACYAVHQDTQETVLLPDVSCRPL